VFDGCKGAETPDCYADGKFGYRLGIRHQKAGHPTPEQIDDDITPRGTRRSFLPPQQHALNSTA
ncbi:MAG: hypothetical protein ACREDN_04900, partial [Aestuariivirga sp.]